jgi:hypothetical protein
VSLFPCPHRGCQLAEASTCGQQCDRFPACLPPPSSALLASIQCFARLEVMAQRTRVRQEGLASALEELHAAILDGIARKSSSHG